MKYSVKKKIIATKLIVDSNFHKIKIKNPELVINSFDVYTDKNNKIEKIIITDGNHPNCNPKDRSFCIPDMLTHLEFNDETINLIESMLALFNFNSAYYLPWNGLEFE